MKHSGGLLAVEHAGEVLGLGGVPAEQTMVTEEPEVTRLGPWLPGRGFERLVEVEGLGALPLLPGIEGAQEVLQLILIEPGQGEVHRTLELDEQAGQELLVPLAGDAVERQAQEPALLGADVEPDDRHRLEPEPSSGHEALVTADDRGVLATRQDGLHEPPLVDAPREGLELGLA